MINKISLWLRRFSSTWRMITSLLVMILFMVFVLPNQAANAVEENPEAGSPDTSFFYTPDELYQMAEDYGPAGRQAYIKARWTFDLVFPLVYTAFLALGISWFSNRLSGWPASWHLANLLPLLGGFFDFLENGATSLAMANYPARSQILLSAASVFTPIKWVLVSASFLPYLIFGAAWVVQIIQKRPAA